MRRILLAGFVGSSIACSGGSDAERSATDAASGDVRMEADGEADASLAPDASAEAASGDGSPADGALADVAANTDGATDAAPGPSCAALAACPATPSVTEGAGPRSIDRCAFVLRDDGKAATYEAALAGLSAVLKKVSVADVLGELNRTATGVAVSTVGAAGFQRGFAWDSDDQGKAWWIPQGISGSFDANATGTIAGRKVVAVTWYYDLAKHPGSAGEKGIRLSLADVTGPTVTYRHLLLVSPKMAAGRADFDPIDIHAGGVAWIGDRLWVADTGRGLRMFDLSRIFEVATTKDTIGWDGSAYQGGLYRYVVPQAALWVDGSKCNPVFSFVGFDRTSSSLVTGEYSATAITGRAFQWPVDPVTGALAATAYASGAWVMAQRQVQGALTRDGAFYLSSSAPPAGGGVLYAAREAKKTLSYEWVDAPEDLMFDGKANQLWSLSEGIGARYVFAVDASAVKAP